MCRPGNTVLIKANGQMRDVDFCIAPIVKALNESGITTIASCCGHDKPLGDIILADGRELIIAPRYEAARDMVTIGMYVLKNHEIGNLKSECNESTKSGESEKE